MSPHRADGADTTARLAGVGVAPARGLLRANRTARQEYETVHQQVRVEMHGAPEARRFVEYIARCRLGRIQPRLWVAFPVGFPRVYLRWFHRPVTPKDRLP